MDSITVRDLLGTAEEDEFMDFDLTEVQGILGTLKSFEVTDFAQADHLQQQALCI